MEEGSVVAAMVAAGTEVAVGGEAGVGLVTGVGWDEPHLVAVVGGTDQQTAATMEVATVAGRAAMTAQETVEVQEAEGGSGTLGLARVAVAKRV